MIAAPALAAARQVVPRRARPYPASVSSHPFPPTRTATATTDSAAQAQWRANRARGSVALEVALAHGRTARTRVREAGSLRVRFPHTHRSELEAVLLNTAGGIAGGDHFSTAIHARAGAELVLTTAAAEKVYRSGGEHAQMDVALRVEAGAMLAWLPQETIVFDRARLARRLDVAVEEGGRLLLAEAVVLGRAAMNEQVAQAELTDRWRVRHAGRLVFAEALRLGGDVAAQLGPRVTGNGAAAFATVLLLPGAPEDVDRVRALEGGFAGAVGASAWNGLALIRLIAPDGAALRHDLLAILRTLRSEGLPRLWSS